MLCWQLQRQRGQQKREQEREAIAEQKRQGILDPKSPKSPYLNGEEKELLKTFKGFFEHGIDGMEEMIVLDGEGDLANREEVIAALKDV